jgi:hypothetical protein
MTFAYVVLMLIPLVAWHLDRPEKSAPGSAAASEGLSS